MRNGRNRSCLRAAAVIGLVFMMTGCKAETKTETAQAFTPSLDTNAAVELNVLGFFGNFEALDQVTVDFNEYYPNITFTYQQVGSDKVESYMDANPGVDIFMTSMRTLEDSGSTMTDRCVDLSAEDMDLSAIDGEMLKLYNRDGRQVSFPMGQNLYGVIVNTSLLEKERLSVPQNEKEWMEVCEALKKRGYAPIQGPDSKVYAELTAGMVFSEICSDEKLYEALKSGDESAAEQLRPAFDFLSSLMDSGYTDLKVNESYPEDNYDQAILRFFEGDVPFWVCSSEKVSGMKKRESKSEAFQSTPFEYEYIYPPLGAYGDYVYQEPWYGFAANVDSDCRDYAIEFLRFLATGDEINKIADIKGVPSVAKEPSHEAIYKNVLSPELRKKRVVNNGTISYALVESWYTCTARFARRECTADEALMEFLHSGALQ